MSLSIRSVTSSFSSAFIDSYLKSRSSTTPLNPLILPSKMSSAFWNVSIHVLSISCSLVSTYSCQVICCTEQKPASVMKITQSSKAVSVCDALPPSCETYSGLERNLRLSISTARCSLVKAEFTSMSFKRLSSSLKMLMRGFGS